MNQFFSREYGQTANQATSIWRGGSDAKEAEVAAAAQGKTRTTTV
jgi:hypothetical protein